MSTTKKKASHRLGFSPCPNDTFIFHGLVTGKVSTPGIQWEPVLEDVETLNKLAFNRAIPVTKASFHAYGNLRESHLLLSAGSALGRGCGPLIVAREKMTRKQLESERIAIPGKWTSAALLLRLFAPALRASQLIEMPFECILESVLNGKVGAGLIIHESRFTYAAQGLVALEDLGRWWEEESGLPIPLGGIIADRTLGEETLRHINRALRESVRHARSHPEESAEYVHRHAQELSEEVTRAHIDLYVNDFTEDLGEMGLKAINALFRYAEAKGILLPFEGSLTL